MNKKVLLIEDDKIVRENTAEILTLANYSVKTAENGKEGVLLAKKHIPDIIICDILMPELDGYGVLQIISQTPELEHIPFIFLSAKTHYEDLRKGMELGADDYITKPFEESELLRAIESRLKRVEAFDQKTTVIETTSQTTHISLENIKNLEKYLAQKKVYKFKKEETIYCTGTQSNHLFLIKKGTVITYKINEQGKEFVTGIFNSQQYFGYTSYIKNLPHFENAKAITNTELYKITKDEITGIINNNNHIVYDFIDLLANNIIEYKEQLILLAYASVRKKTARTLLNLLKKQQHKTDSEIIISRKNLANSIGIAKETLIRTLHDFKNEKLIEVNTKNIKILDKNKLFKIQ